MAGPARQRRRPAGLSRRAPLREPGPYRAGTGAAEGCSVSAQGRYVLRGDGITTAYQWVWIPNPPSTPPAARDSAARARADLSALAQLQ